MCCNFSEKSSESIVNRVAATVAFVYIGFETVRLFGLTLTDDFTVESKIS